MKWLITVKVDVDSQSLQEALVSLGCKPEVLSESIPMGEHEHVFEVTCSNQINLPEKAKGEAMILQINPSSEMQLYGIEGDYSLHN